MKRKENEERKYIEDPCPQIVVRVRNLAVFWRNAFKNVKGSNWSLYTEEKM
jgi:hypothetical protein